MLKYVLSAAIITRALITPVYAVSAPNFPLCTNPQGTLKVSYANGTHGIVGSTATYEGKDSVYQVSDTTSMQCFCSVNGSGIQTNWWNASSLSEEQVNQLKAEGWYYVADGGLWGLDSDPFVAQNHTYSCLPQDGGTGGPGDGKSDGRSSCPECTQAPIGGGDVLGISTEGQVLGLASTGDLLKILAIFGYAAVFFLIGTKLSQKRSN
jgi:hypothetical protein